MPDSVDRYILHGGQAGYDRLLVLARERAEDTESVLQRAGLSPGMRVLDLGCGGGEVSLRMAELVGPTGSVVGRDMDRTQLELARAEAARRRLSNVSFVVGTVADWDESAAYDFVFSRFLLQHLREPEETLTKLWNALRAPGVMVVEDADHDSWTMFPPDSGFDFFRTLMLAAQRRAGGDPELGRKLYYLALRLGLPNPELTLRATARVTGEGKTLPLLTLDAIRATLTSEGLANESEIEAARESLAKALANPETLVVGPRIFQLVCRKT